MPGPQETDAPISADGHVVDGLRESGMRWAPETIRRLGAGSLAGGLAFVAASAALQFLRADLDWRLAPLSFYLVGPHGGWLQAAYVALACTLAMLGAGCYAASTPAARSAAPLSLFAAASVALVVTAFAHTNHPSRPPTFEGFVHGLAAQTAFLCVTTAMLLQGWRFRLDPRWRGRFALGFGLAALCFAALWWHALWRDGPRGLTQKLVIAAIVAWLGLVAFWLRRTGGAMGDAVPDA